jgi:hypothetical protein
MALKRDGAEVVNKTGMDFGDQLTGWLGEGMPDSMFEFVEGEGRQVQRLAVIVLIRLYKKKRTKFTHKPLRSSMS